MRFLPYFELTEITCRFQFPLRIHSVYCLLYSVFFLSVFNFLEGLQQPSGRRAGGGDAAGDGFLNLGEEGFDLPVAHEVILEVVHQQGPHPVAVLLAPLGGELAAFLHRFPEGDHVLPDGVDPLVLQGTAKLHRHDPVRAFRRHHVQGVFVLAAGEVGAGAVVPFSLVDDDGIGDLHDATLDPLQLVTGTRQLQQQEHVDHRGDGDFRLADANRLDDDDIVAGRLTDQHGFAGLAGDAAEGITGRRGADEGVAVAGEVLHAGLVAEDRATGKLRGRVDGEHGDLEALLGQVQAKGFNEGAFPDPGDAGDTDAHRLAGGGEQLVEQGGGGQRMVRRATLDQGDRLGQRAEVAVTNPFGDVVDFDHNLLKTNPL